MSENDEFEWGVPEGESTEGLAINGKEFIRSEYEWDPDDKVNYPFYVPQDFRSDLDRLANHLEARLILYGEDGIEKHRDILCPLIIEAIREVDAEKIVRSSLKEKE
jgi:hypothetical protein